MKKIIDKLKEYYNFIIVFCCILIFLGIFYTFLFITIIVATIIVGVSVFIIYYFIKKDKIYED
jgi:hypothetical protein